MSNLKHLMWYSPALLSIEFVCALFSSSSIEYLCLSIGKIPRIYGIALYRRMQTNSVCSLKSFKIYTGTKNYDLDLFCRLIARCSSVTRIEKTRRRVGYIDVCRLYTTEESFCSFEAAIGCKLRTPTALY